MNSPVRNLLLATFTFTSTSTFTGCILAAAGAGAGGAIYVTERGAEAQIAAPVSRALDASRQVFQELAITETRSTTEQSTGGGEKRTLEGKTADREVSVNLQTAGTGSRVEVVVKKTAVTWDKDFAKQILNKIVEGTK